MKIITITMYYQKTNVDCYTNKKFYCHHGTMLFKTRKNK